MKLADELREYDPEGFFTEEIREHGVRTGFRLTSLDTKQTGVLAHVDIKSPNRVGRYGVDLEGFERFLGALRLRDPSPRLVVLDEIGKMECKSERFRNLVTSLLDAPAPVIATIALRAGGFIEEVKHRRDVRLYELTERNRDSLLPDVAGLIRSSLTSGRL
jgi:nucleoside-triphosphatase